MSDYVREVLGISMRSVQEMMHTEKCLQKLPETAVCWEMGLLQSEQVRLLCRMAEPVWEAHWAYEAQRLSVRQLAEEIRKWKAAREREREEYRVADSCAGAGMGSCSGACQEAASSEPGLADESDRASAGFVGEQSSDLGHRSLCPSSVNASRQCDRDLSAAPLESVVGNERQPEGVVTAGGQRPPIDEAGSLDGSDDDTDSFERISFPAPLPTAVRWRMTLRMCKEISGQELADWALAENICADYLAGRALPPEETARLEGSGGEEAIREALARNPESYGAQSSQDAGSTGSDDRNECDGPVEKGNRSNSVSSDKMVSADEPIDADRMKHCLGPWLPRALDLFLDEKPPEDAWELSRRIERLATLRTRIEALLSRRLYEFVYHEEPWRAGYKTMVGYAQEVLGLSERRARYLMSLERRLFSAPAVREAYRRGELSWLSCLLLLRVARGDDSEKAWVEYAKQVPVLRLREAVEEGQLRAAVEYPCLPPRVRDGNEEANGSRGGAGNLQMSARPGSVASNGGESRSDGRCKDARCKDEPRMSARVPNVRIMFSAPRDVAALWRQTMAEVRRLEGQDLKDWEALERMLDSFIATWDDENARRIRREHQIIERDGWRCTVPVCSSRQNLHAHHVKFRSRGGCDEPWNMTTLCIPHHQHAVHGPEAGRVKVIGRAPRRLRWELGCREGDPPAFVFEGERRVRLSHDKRDVTFSSSPRSFLGRSTDG